MRIGVQLFVVGGRCVDVPVHHHCAPVLLPSSPTILEEGRSLEGTGVSAWIFPPSAPLVPYFPAYQVLGYTE